MEIVKTILIVGVLMLSQLINGQNLETRKHLVSATATIATGFQKDNADINIYLHGLASFYPEPKVSIDGEIYWFLGGQNQLPLMAENSSIVFGMNYHFAKDGKMDPFIGIMPGISIVSVNNYLLQYPIASEYSIVPLVTINAGFKFHMAKWCNAFCNVRYLKGTLVENHFRSLALDEIRLSFGLGFNLYGKGFYGKN